MHPFNIKHVKSYSLKTASRNFFFKFYSFGEYGDILNLSMIALLVSKNIKKKSFFTVRHKQQGGIDVLKIVACHLNLA